MSSLSDIHIYSSDSDSTRPIKIPDVENELARLWGQAREAKPGNGPPVTRTVLLNLVAYCRKHEKAESVSQMITGLTADHPSRAIIICDDPESNEADLVAQVSIACQLAGRGEKQVCGEHIFMEAHGAPPARVVGAILPLTLPDLPLLVWIPDCAGIDAPHIETLVNQADRFLFDSATVNCPERLFNLVNTLASEKSLICVDLCWLRLAGVRLAIARQFDNPLLLEMIPLLKSVHLEFPEGTPESERRLLAGWICDRLGWRINSVEDCREFATLGGNTFSLICVKKAEFDLQVSFVTETGQKILTVRINNGRSAVIVESPITKSNRKTPHAAAPSCSETEMLCGALEITRQDVYYLNALRALIC